MKKTIKDYEYNGKRVIIRCDLNVPIKDGKVTDDTRIKESLESLNYLINHDAKVIILSHLGKIKTEEDKKDNSLHPVYLKLKEYLNTNVYFSEETRGKILENKVNSLKNGEVLLVENTRYEDFPNKLESSCDEELSKYWAGLGDIYINDAYGTCHRVHASNVGIARLLPNGIGFLVEKEITKIEEILHENTHPYTIVMGGKKISDKKTLSAPKPEQRAVYSDRIKDQYQYPAAPAAVIAAPIAPSAQTVQSIASIVRATAIIPQTSPPIRGLPSV